MLIQALLDETMPAASTVALARNLGVAVLDPHLAIPEGLVPVASPAAANVLGETAVLVQYEPATHGYNWSALHGELKYQPGGPQPGDDTYPKLATPIAVTEPIYATQAQVAQLLTTHLSGNPPVGRHDRDAGRGLRRRRRARRRLSVPDRSDALIRVR